MGLETAKGAMQGVGAYDLLEKIAEGGMGAIYRGRHRESGEIVAVKVLPAHMAANETLRKRFEQEFKAASAIDHPNIVRAMDFGESGSTYYLVMEFVDGESLGQRIEREGRMPEADAIRVIAQVAQGLHRAHKLNLVHRDVKPDNILVDRAGQAKLADLGLVKQTETDLNLTKTGRGLGTPHFMAPEQFRDAKNADIRCDIYSLGATLYQMVTGVLPFKSSGPLDAWMKKMQNDLREPRELVPTLSERLNWAILRAMSADPEQRPKSCREFIEDLTGHSTRRVQTTKAGSSTSGSSTSSSSVPDLWYLIYRDDEGATHTVKGSTTAIRRSLKDGLLGDASNVRASRSKSGPWESLQLFPEFRDMLIAAAPMPTLPTSPSRTESTVPSRPSYKEPTAPPVAQSATQPATRVPPVSRPVPIPHIELEDRPTEGGLGWTTWLMLLGLTLVSAAAAFYFFKK
ncbi:MAG: protein kinase [Gemmataceae bacterium]